ncbi:SdpI family protein [Clostridium sp. L74]|uniref:SdpI family protein n=1 Tax=Clostridium sp. L74 TaxID=1560217 RepID=UPI0006AB91C3|nr:SdpI family protein [Clostridium sp. L74]EJP6473927.1 SdpI family protein [Clostridium botulinum]KOR24804.1 hypothetical protein ND00_22510 [Clostridium sp. L74]
MISLISAVIFIGFGFLLMKWPPEDINSVYGYRTPFSMKNQDTWDESQRYAGFSMIILGIIQGILGIFLIIQSINIDKESIQLLFLLIGVIVMLIIDEKHLRNLFNKDGTRKSKV